jgi:hypothetical protein
MQQQELIHDFKYFDKEEYKGLKGKVKGMLGEVLQD